MVRLRSRLVSCMENPRRDVSDVSNDLFCSLYLRTNTLIRSRDFSPVMQYLPFFCDTPMIPTISQRSDPCAYCAQHSQERSTAPNFSHLPSHLSQAHLHLLPNPTLFTFTFHSIRAYIAIICPRSQIPILLEQCKKRRSEERRVGKECPV